MKNLEIKTIDKTMSNEGKTVICKNIEPLAESGIAPPLELEKEYEINKVIVDSKGNEHWDVGLESNYNFITSIETGEELEDGDEVHWCHPSRFEFKE